MCRGHLGSANDRAISPVIGVILMVAATVVIAGAVYAGMNAYHAKTGEVPIEAKFKADATDANEDGLEDSVRVTYVGGPDGLAANVTVRPVLGGANATIRDRWISAFLISWKKARSLGFEPGQPPSI